MMESADIGEPLPPAGRKDWQPSEGDVLPRVKPAVSPMGTDRPWAVPSLYGPRGEDFALQNQLLQLVCNELMDLLAQSQSLLTGKKVYVNQVVVSPAKVHQHKLMAVKVSEDENCGVLARREGNGS